MSDRHRPPTELRQPQARRIPRPSTRTAALLVGTLATVAYAATAAPSIVALFDDSLEFQLVLPTLAIAHPTGYPLYTLLGFLWSRLLFPVGNWAWRVNIFSALCAGAAVGLLFVLARRLTGSHLAALAGTLLFAIGPIWWNQATVAEVYALHNLLVVAIVLATLRLGRPVSGCPVSGRPETQERLPTPLTLFLLAGLSLAHHRTAALLAPALALYLLWRRRDLLRPRRAWLGWLAVLLLPLLLYLLLPLRAAMGASDLQGDYVNSLAGFWHHVLARGYAGFFGDNPLAVSRNGRDWLLLFQSQIGWVGLALAVVGLATGLASDRRRPEWSLIALALLANLLFVLLYRTADVEVFALPVLLCLALLAAGGVADLGALAARARGNAAALLVQTALLALLLLPGLPALPAQNRANDWAAHNYAVSMAKVDFPPGSLVVGLRGQTTALTYLQRAEGLGRNATGVPADAESERRRIVAEAVAAGRPLYLTQELPSIAADYSFSGEGPLVRVWPRGRAESGAPGVARIEQMADAPLSLLGYDLATLDQAGGPALRIAFYWRADAPIERILKLSLRLVDESGAPLLNGAGAPLVADRFPLRQAAPTPTWLPGELLRDADDLPLPPQRPASVTLQVIVYDAESVAEVGRFAIDLPPQ